MTDKKKQIIHLSLNNEKIYVISENISKAYITNWNEFLKKETKKLCKILLIYFVCFNLGSLFSYFFIGSTRESFIICNSLYISFLLIRLVNFFSTKAQIFSHMLDTFGVEENKKQKVEFKVIK